MDPLLIDRWKNRGVPENVPEGESEDFLPMARRQNLRQLSKAG